MAEFVYAAQTVALEQGSQGTYQRRRKHHRRPKPHPLCKAVADIGPQHVKTSMRKVQHTHHAKNQGQTRTEHEQQQAVAQAVEA